MVKKSKSTVLVFFVSLLAAVSAFGQGTDAAIKPVYVKGDVVSIDAAKIVVKTDTGSWDGGVGGNTAFKRVSPDNPKDLAGATTIALADIGVGDKIVLSALQAKDGGFVVRTVYVITKSDLTARDQKEADRWRNGIFGRVATVKSDQIMVETGSGLTKTTVTVNPKADAKFLRYQPDSLNFSDAKPSTISEIKPGDQIRAAGEKSADGTSITAEELLSGTFKTTVGKIKSVDADRKEVVVEDLGTKKEVTVSFANVVVFKKFPADMATRMAGQGAGGGVRPPGGGVTPPNGGGQNGGQPSGGGFRPGGGGGNLDSMIDRLPNITVADLKVGDMIGVLTSGQVAGVDHIKALKLLAGVEPFIEMAQRQAAAAGARGSANSPNFNIPRPRWRPRNSVRG